ncbi:MAG: hypothetical protein JO304_05755, partial [Solirubrobacterales bacterium]|nr:hypothetical protein [Solirubrobacterales bacterium]
MRARTVGLRGRLLVSVVGGITVVLAALVLAFNLILAERLANEATALAQARASAVVSALRIAGDRIVLPDAPDDRSPDTQIWVFQGQRAIEQPRSATDDTAADALAPAAPRLRDVAATGTRLYALPVVQGGRRLGAVVAGVSLVPYKQTRRTALIASLLLA